jgi:N-acetylmuramoyl-L-alanine amidase
MKFCISSGHGKYIRGASGSPVPPQLDEVDQARRVVDRVAEFMKQMDIGVETFHDNTSHDQNTNLHTITNWHNSKTRDYDVSIHFNAYDGSAHGTEVLYVTQSSLAKKVCDAICEAGGFTNRGAKYRSDLYVLNNTEQPAVLIETCFCDNTADSNKYNSAFDAICEAIAESLSGEHVPDIPEPGPEPEPEPIPGELVVSIAITAPPGVNIAVTQTVSGAQGVTVLRKSDA